MRNKKIVSALCVFLALLMALSLIFSVIGSTSAYAASQSRIDALEEQKEQLRAEREGMQSSIDELKSQQADALAQKQALDEQNELNRQEIELINEQIDLYTELIRQKAEEVEEAQEAEENQYQTYCTHVRAMEENGRFTYLAILFSSKSLSELLSNIDMIGEIMDADKRLYEEYTAARERTEQVKAEYEATLVELEDKQDELEAEKAALEEAIAAAEQLIAELEEDIEAYTKEFEANAAAEAALQSQIDNMTAQLRAQEEAARQQAAQNNTTYTGVGANSSGSYIWPAPSSTYVTSAFGYRMHPIFQTERYHAGIDIGASAGSNVLAADGGTVQTATYSASYGNYIVIYHSGGTTTTYAHMSSLAVSEGDSVSQGDVIGYVGSTGWSTGPHLHFEIAINGSRVDPLGYFSNYSLAPDA